MAATATLTSARTALPGGSQVTGYPPPGDTGKGGGKGHGFQKGDGREGWTGDQIFEGGEHGLSLEEVTVLPGAELPGDAAETTDIVTRLTRNMHMRVPLIAKANPKTCESAMAIAVALQGGIGILHRRQSVEDQCQMIRRVKMHEVGFILDPVVLGPRATAQEVIDAKASRGCGCIPITKNGRLGGVLIGIVTTRDIEDISDMTTQVNTFSSKELVTATQPISLREARKKMQDCKVGKLPIVNEDGELVALLTRGDLKRCMQHPEASRDSNGQLLAAAEFGVSDEGDYDRAQALLAAGADVLVMDISECGVTDYAVDVLKRLKTLHLGTDVIVGPVTSSKQALDLCVAGCDGLIVGGGNATRFEATSIYEISKFARNSYGMPCIADIGVSNGTQLAKALALGASAVSVSSLLDGTEEVPGDHYYHDGVRVKLRKAREAQASLFGDPLLRGRPEVETAVPASVVSRGSIHILVPHLLRGVRGFLQAIGVARLQDVAKALAQGVVRFERQLSCVVDPAPRLLRASVSPLNCPW
eukprot:TRINITY_DN74861_c0_g1_i1.p1 TRINITY_DN74861_c0_g1~~TRINITY_DN74861_c0_g1_i1.p1  ORF type:complete len:531 (+),score=135.98 TRINITY_DN74861_c0_g1_i1:130-1722(+)